MPTERCVTTLTLTPMTKEEAAKLLKRLLASYPTLNLHDPKGYMANLTSLLTAYPLWVGERALPQIKTAAPEWPPAEGKVRRILEDVVRYQRYAAEWKEDAAHMIEDRREPRQKESYEELKAKYGPNWGITNPDTPRPPSRGEVLADIYARYGRDKVDAVPDAGEDAWRKLKSDYGRDETVPF